jgi:hypothetical protein
MELDIETKKVADSHRIRQSIINTIGDCKFRCIAFDLKLDKYRHNERLLKIIFGVTSIGTISAWFATNNYTVLWATILLAIEVLRVLEPIWNFKKRTEELNSKRLKLALLSVNLEKLYNNISYGFIDIATAIEEHKVLSSEQETILKFPDNMDVKISSKIKKQADVSVRLYLKKTYDIDVSLN